MTRFTVRRPLALVALAAAAAVVAGGGALLLASLAGDDDGDAPQELAAGARALVAAYEHSRLATYVVETTFTREREGRQVTAGERRIAQRPPDRVETTGSGAQARLAGRRFGCVAGPDGSLSCRQGGAVRPYEEVVASEVERLRRQVLGGDRIYNVADLGGGCFRLRLVRPIPAPPFGDLARMCFDRETGALVESAMQREDGTIDRTVAVEVRPEVLDADLALPEAGTGG